MVLVIIAASCGPPPAVSQPPVVAAIAVPTTAATWPMSPIPDPRVTAMPADVQTSIETVGAYLAQQFTDPRERVKALHDYVLLRVRYDQVSAMERTLNSDDPAHELASQAPDVVFARRTAVCEGYARLLEALGHAAGIDIVVVAGDAYDDDREPIGQHAWDLVLLDGRWQPIDATWDDTDPPSSEFLLTPDDLFRATHAARHFPWPLEETAVAGRDVAGDTRAFMAWFTAHASERAPQPR